MRLTKKSLTTLLISVLLVAVPVSAWSQRQDISDWYRLRNYQPSQEIEQLAVSTTMTDLGQKLFYVHRPSLEDKQSFNQNCRDSEKSLVLGCYVHGQGIYIYNVRDERLGAIKEVTAAHEMLHAAYDRLPTDERNRIDNLLVNTFNDVQNERIEKTIENYRNKDASVVPNELHSILGTEVRELPQELDDHYAKYFKDRMQVVVMAEGYEKVFAERQAKIASYDDRLQALRTQIDTNQARLSEDSARIASERARMENLLAQKRSEEYNAAVPGYNALVRSYNGLITTTKGLIDEFNEIVKLRNDIASEENELIKALDSRPEAIQAQ